MTDIDVFIQQCLIAKNPPEPPWELLDLTQITDFQLKVYKALLLIPRGETRSYQDVATMIGQPSAARAVGNALNKNPYPIIFPCHRVIRSDGSLGGFAEGVEIKAQLLAKEGVLCEG